MIITFYDKNFKALSENSSLVIEQFSLTRRAYDLNEFNCTCEPISLDIEPLFAVMKTNDGTRYYDMLRPIVTKGSDGKSEVVARDLFGVLNTECFIDMTQLNDESVEGFIRFIFQKWKEWDKSGFDTVTLALDENISYELEDGKPKQDENGNLVLKELYRPTAAAVYNVKDLFSKTLAYYDLYINSYVDLRNKTLCFEIKRNNLNIMNIRLEDFGIEDFAKYEPSVNTAVVYAQRPGRADIRHNWYLLKDGSITNNVDLRDVYPTSCKVFYIDGAEIDNGSGTDAEKDAEYINKINEADFEAVTTLAENRYQETIEIDIAIDYERLQDIEFNTSFNVYYRGSFYKQLPLGEIVDDGTKSRLLRIGYKPVEFIQVV